MKKWIFSKNKNKNKKKSPPEKDEKEKDFLKQIGTFHDFLVFDNNDKYKENNIVFQDCPFDDPSLKDWLIIKNSPNKTKSRFSSLFEEMEKDKKTKSEGKSNEINEQNNINVIKDNYNINNDNKDSNNNIIIINDNKNLDKNNIIYNNKKIDNINNINNINIGNNNDNINNINIDNINDNIKSNNNIINDNNEFMKYNSNININSRNNSESLTNANTINNNLFQDGKPSELSFSFSNQNLNVPLVSPNLYEPKKSINSNYSCHSGPHEQKKSIYSNYSGYSGPHERNKSIYTNYSGPYEQKKTIYSTSSGQVGNSIYESEYHLTNSIKSNISMSERGTIFEPRPSEKKYELTVDIKKIIFLEDRRTTVMIKNIPNKFNRDLLLNIIDQNFKGAYDIFILPTDVNGYKNFGYSFINFTCCYYIPYFYYLFNGKKWSSTNSKKICEITYSKIQGKNSLISHYSNKIIFRNDEVKKFSSDHKYIIPNEYRMIFNKAFPNQFVEEYQYYFITKMPFKY